MNADLIEIKSDIKYIKTIVEDMRNDIRPLHDGAQSIKGGMYVAAAVGSLIMGGASYFIHDKVSKINHDIYDLQNQVALINSSNILVKSK